jgi:hypothetical protein
LLRNNENNKRRKLERRKFYRLLLLMIDSIYIVNRVQIIIEVVKSIFKLKDEQFFKNQRVQLRIMYL